VLIKTLCLPRLGAALPLLCLSASVTLAASPPASTSASSEVVAEGGSITLSSADVRALVDSLSAPERSAATASTASLEQVARSEIMRRALTAEAKSKNFDRKPETIAALDHVRDDALVRLWVASQAAVPDSYPSEQEIKDAYEANKAALAAPTSYHVAQIYISAADGADPAKLAAAFRKATDLAAQIGKVDFAQLAQQQSEQPESAAHGGDLGYLSEDKMLAPIAAVLRTLKVGEVAGPVKTTAGLHFLKLLDKKPGAVPTLQEARDRVASALRAQRASELQQAYLKGLNTRFAITVNQIALAHIEQGAK
jgi:peptidylprolyl isomerase